MRSINILSNQTTFDSFFNVFIHSIIYSCILFHVYQYHKGQSLKIIVTFLYSSAASLSGTYDLLLTSTFESLVKVLIQSNHSTLYSCPHHYGTHLLNRSITRLSYVFIFIMHSWIGFSLPYNCNLGIVSVFSTLIRVSLLFYLIQYTIYISPRCCINFFYLF